MNRTPFLRDKVLNNRYLRALGDKDRDMVSVPVMHKEGGEINVETRGMCMCLSNRLIDAPFDVNLNRRTLSSLALKIMDIAVAVLSDRVTPHRVDYFNERKYAQPNDLVLTNSNAEQDAASIVSVNFSSIESRTVRLSSCALDQAINAITDKEGQSASKPNTNFLHQTVKSLIRSGFSVRFSNDGCDYEGDVNVFEKVLIGLAGKNTRKISDIYLVFSQSFVEELCGLQKFTRFDLSHHYALGNSYAVRAFRLLTSRASRSKQRDVEGYVFKVVHSIDGWRKYLDVSERVEYKTGAEDELRAWASKSRKGLFDNTSQSFVNSVFVDDIGAAISKYLDRNEDAKNDPVGAAVEMLLEDNRIDAHHLGECENFQKFKGKSMLVYLSTPYAVTGKLKQEVFLKCIVENINKYTGGGVKIVEVKTNKKGREVTSIEIKYTFDSTKHGYVRG